MKKVPVKSPKDVPENSSALRLLWSELMNSAVFKHDLIDYLSGDTIISNVTTGGSAAESENATAINNILTELRKLGPVAGPGKRTIIRNYDGVTLPAAYTDGEWDDAWGHDQAYSNANLPTGYTSYLLLGDSGANKHQIQAEFTPFEEYAEQLADGVSEFTIQIRVQADANLEARMPRIRGWPDTDPNTNNNRLDFWPSYDSTDSQYGIRWGNQSGGTYHEAFGTYIVPASSVNYNHMANLDFPTWYWMELQVNKSVWKLKWCPDQAAPSNDEPADLTAYSWDEERDLADETSNPPPWGWKWKRLGVQAFTTPSSRQADIGISDIRIYFGDLTGEDVAWDRSFVSRRSRGSFLPLLKKLPDDERTTWDELLRSITFRHDLVDYLQGDTSISDVPTGGSATAAGNATAINSILSVLRSLGPIDE